MATATPTWDSCRIHGRWVTQNGALLAGSYRVRVPVRITNANGDVIVPAGEFASGRLTTAAGASKSLDLMVPASEDPDNFPPGDWKIIVDITFDDRNLTPEQYIISTPVNGDINLRTVILPTQIPDYADLAIKGVPGGLAELDSEGYVVNADGTRPSSGGGGTGGGGTGTPGEDGREVELRSNGSFIQWRYVGMVDWIDLVSLASLKGPTGNTGPSVELENDGTNVRWRPAGTTTWTTLVALSALRGPGVEMQRGTSALQWRGVGTTAWTDLISYDDLKAQLGLTGMETRLQQVEGRPEFFRVASSASTDPAEAEVGDLVLYESAAGGTTGGGGGTVTPTPTITYAKRFYGEGLAAETPLVVGTKGTDDDAFEAVAPSTAGTNSPLIRITDGIVEIKTANSTASSSYRWNTLNMPRFSFACGFRHTTAVASSGVGVVILTGITRLTMNTSNQLVLLDQAGAYVTQTSQPLGLSTTPVYDPGSTAATGLYQLRIWRASGTAGELTKIRVYNPAGTLILDQSRDFGVTALTTVLLGRDSNVAGTFWHSKPRVADLGTEIPL